MLRSKAIVDSDAVLREAETESDCLSDRAAALDEQKVSDCLPIFRLSNDSNTDFDFRAVPKQFMCQNVRSMVDINEFNATVRPAIVGVCTKTLARIFREHRSKMADPIVQWISRDPWKDVPNRKNWNFWRSSNNFFAFKSPTMRQMLGIYHLSLNFF